MMMTRFHALCNALQKGDTTEKNVPMCVNPT